MSATVIPFPVVARRSVPTVASPFSAAWWEGHAELIGAGVELLQCDDAEFDRRFRLMQDQDGRSLLGDFAGRMERLGGCIADVGDALGLAAARINAALLGPPG